MRILVTGSRDWEDELTIELVLKAMTLVSPGSNTLVVGGARGADQIAQDCAVRLGMSVDLYPADWPMYHKAAGPIRNKQMVDSKPDICFAFVNKGSKGAKDCAILAMKAGIPTVVYGPGASEVTSQPAGSEGALLTSASKNAQDRANQTP